jgi:hypothetical protein
MMLEIGSFTTGQISSMLSMNGINTLLETHNSLTTNKTNKEKSRLVKWSAFF